MTDEPLPVMAQSPSKAFPSTCPFCDLDPARVLFESDLAIAIRDAYAVTEGHTLIMPRRHVQSIFHLDVAEQTAMWSMVAKVRHALGEEFAPDGINIGINDGRAAGQTVDHAHIHVIPRRYGDVPDPRGGVRNVIPDRVRYWEK